MDSNTNKKITTFLDYMPQLIESNPDLTKRDISFVIRCFQAQLLSIIRTGLSFSMSPQKCHYGKFSMLLNGNSKTNPLERYIFRKGQFSKKLKKKFKDLNRTWNGYYYIHLNDEQFAKLLSQKKKFAHNKKYYVFENFYLYKLFEDCVSYSNKNSHIFRIRMQAEIGQKIYKKQYKSQDFEYIYMRRDYELIRVKKDMKFRCDNSLFKQQFPTNKNKFIDHTLEINRELKYGRID